MINAIVKSMFYFTIILTFALKLSAKEFEVINGNGALSHDQKWYASIDTVSYKDTPFLRFEVINLKKNKYNASPFFTYSKEMREAIPEALLFHKEFGYSRNADIRWTKDSKKVFVFFDSGYRESTFVISYEVNSGNISTFYIEREKYSEIKKNHGENNLPAGFSLSSKVESGVVDSIPKVGQPK